MIEPPEVRLDHLRALTDGRGLFEHAKGRVPRLTLGYCTDDVSRALVLVTRSGRASGLVISATYLRFLAWAVTDDGRVHNRMAPDGRWLDLKGPDETHGRALWALGHYARYGSSESTRRRALNLFERAANWTSPYPRPLAHASLGAAAILAAHPGHTRAHRLVADWLHMVGRFPLIEGTPWPEPRLTYANGRLPQALMVAGQAVDEGKAVDRGLAMLEWLVEQETTDEHFSFTPVGGWWLGEPRPGFDQQPIEASAMADACWQAYQITLDPIWLKRVEMVGNWVMGKNDSGAVMYEANNGGGYDGLTPTGVNSNQGAESTISILTVLYDWHQAQAASASSRSASSISAAPTAWSAPPYVK
jgi:hypothetical protein